ncbi:hypothetical protein GJ744_000499 [Endocarpon pusillum]|uniref:Uncharacterized protein n=1 Tax=Endocarpon pusillum TaxID=364733 RepID=A0A8H7ABF4_9EURO|nr:hypothetical protein GJ744_000499 [Endocarpon pusillum]
MLITAYIYFTMMKMCSTFSHHFPSSCIRFDSESASWCSTWLGDEADQMHQRALATGEKNARPGPHFNNLVLYTTLEWYTHSSQWPLY